MVTRFQAQLEGDLMLLFKMNTTDWDRATVELASVKFVIGCTQFNCTSEEEPTLRCLQFLSILYVVFKK